MINTRFRNQRANIGHNIPESRIEHETINGPPEVPGPKERYNDDARGGDRERRADALRDGDGGHLLPTEMTAIFAHELLTYSHFRAPLGKSGFSGENSEARDLFKRSLESPWLLNFRNWNCTFHGGA